MPLKKIIIPLFLLSTLLQISNTKHLTFEELTEQLIKENTQMKIIAVAGADSEETLQTCRLAKDKKICDSILIGDEEKIKNIAKEAEIDISDFKLVNIKDPIEISRYTTKIVHDGVADMYYKGSVETDVVLKSISDPEIGLKTNKIFSYVAVFEFQGKILFLTDPVIVSYPTLEEKIKLIENCVDFARSVGIEVPKVAVVAAVSVVSPKMVETVEANTLTEMNKKNEIKNCIVDGPMSLDLAVSKESVEMKQSDRRINGDADIILFPDVHSGNVSYKILKHLSKAMSGNVLLGPKRPVIINSRADNVQMKLNSIVLGFTYDKFNKENNK